MTSPSKSPSENEPKPAFEPAPDTQSVLVDFEDTTGRQERYELRSKPKDEKLEDDTDVLSDISIVAMDDK